MVLIVLHILEQIYQNKQKYIAVKIVKKDKKFDYARRQCQIGRRFRCGSLDGAFEL